MNVASELNTCRAFFSFFNIFVASAEQQTSVSIVCNFEYVRSLISWMSYMREQYSRWCSSTFHTITNFQCKDRSNVWVLCVGAHYHQWMKTRKSLTHRKKLGFTVINLINESDLKCLTTRNNWTLLTLYNSNLKARFRYHRELFN